MFLRRSEMEEATPLNDVAVGRPPGCPCTLCFSTPKTVSHTPEVQTGGCPLSQFDYNPRGFCLQHMLGYIKLFQIKLFSSLFDVYQFCLTHHVADHSFLFAFHPPALTFVSIEVKANV
jgi:hypothetical protein